MLKDISGATEDEKEQKERLEMLLKLAKTKIQTYKDKIESNFAIPGSIDKIQIPGIRAMRYIEQYHVAAKEGLDDKVKDHMDAAIDAFFSIGGEGDTKKAVQGGVKSLISTALSGFIGSTEVGESEQQVYVVVPENNAFIRADIACWKYHFEQHKFIHQTDTAVAYVLCKSVIDHTKITLDELIYLATEAMATRTDIEPDNYYSKLDAAAKKKVDALVDEFAKKPVAEKSASPMPTLTDAQKTTLSETNKNIYLDFDWKESDVPTEKGKGRWIAVPSSHQLIDGSHSSSTPLGIAEVSAYIEELIKVWKKLKEDRG
jgi:hypothetical protein